MNTKSDTCRPMTMARLTALVARAWAAETSADERGWSSDNPAHGQCAVTALIVQDSFGGDLLRVVNEGTSHYFNLMPDGAWVDLTRSQFTEWAPDFDPEVRERDYVLSFPETARRYALLRHRMGESE